MDIFFFEAFEEEQAALKKYNAGKFCADYTWKTIQEYGSDNPPADIISVRTQSKLPLKWAKKLKAIYATGSGKLSVARPKKLKTLRAELKEVYQESIGISAISSPGTASHMDVGILMGDIPIKNWQMSDWELIDELGPATIEEKIFAGST